MKTDTDVIELLLFLRDHSLPEESDERIEILNALTNATLFYIYYEDVCQYSPTFQKHYPKEVIKGLLRKGNITGRKVAEEISHSNLNAEEQAILRFFFKGKVN